MDRPIRSQWFGVAAGLLLAAGLMGSAFLLSQTWLRISESQTISVTGAARRAVRSDLILWRGSFATEASDLAAAQRELGVHRQKVDAFMRARAVSGHVFSSIEIRELRVTGRAGEDQASGRLAGFRLSQSVEVRSEDVDRLAALDQETSALVEEGLVFTTEAPRFVYTRAGEAKVEMLAEATRDARNRAEQIAAQGGRTIRSLRQARMGVFQITPIHSLETSWEGMNDTTSRDKTITAVVQAVFSMD